ncbi:MAG: anhydro-N-acetylmuramic acid kinase [Thermodesulfovibrionales bacterium]|nr:anhydro-N-acetylmuramic acid kinase [Thermodesulfovibrionales bacterium]
MFKIAKKRNARIIGLMSGTSHDGVDAALVEIREGLNNKISEGYNSNKIKIKLINHIHLPFNRSLRNEIGMAFKGNVEHICRLNFKLGEVFARAALTLLKGTEFRPEDIDAIASHGQNIYHIPPSGRKAGSTPS